MPTYDDIRFLDLVWLLEMTHEDYVARFRATAIRRAKRWMLQRNAAIALGNVGGPEALPHLVRAMQTNPHPIVRGHAAWAVGRLGSRFSLPEAQIALEKALQDEEDESVRQEIQQALLEL